MPRIMENWRVAAEGETRIQVKIQRQLPRRHYSQYYLTEQWYKLIRNLENVMEITKL